MRWPWSRKQRHTFDSAPRPIDQLFAELYGAADGTVVSRSDALSVPAVRRGRNIICAVGTMPLEQLGPDNRLEPSALLRQVDPDVANVVTVAQTIEDLLFEGVAWWEVTATDFAGFPVAAKHLDAKSVSVNPPNTARSPAPLPSGLDPRGGVVWVDGNPVPWSRVIRFDSPNPALLAHGGREVRRAVLLERAAGMYADDPRPLDYFTPADGAEELDDDETAEFLNRWKAARKQRTTAYIPASAMYHSVDTPAPRDLQLAELSRQASLDIANALGIDPEDLGLSTTSRTYSNDVDRRRNRLNDTLAPYMRAVTDRLSMGDVTRRGYRVRFNTTEYLQPNPTDRWATYSTAKGMGAMTVDEVRAAEGLPPLPAGAEPEMGPAMEVDAARPSAHTFAEVGLTFADIPVAQFSVDRENRIIEGLALPYNRVAEQGGIKFQFEPGALQWDADNPGRVKLLRDHDYTQPLGRAIQLRDTPDGVLARFKVARGRAGDEALELAEDGVLDGFSVGVDFDPRKDARPDARDRTIQRVRRADWRETSLTAMPSFDDARVTRVAASRTTGEGHMADETTESATEPAPDPDPAPAAEAEAVTFTADQVKAMFAGLDTSGDQGPERPATVNPTRGVALSRVTDPASYRFARNGSLLPAAHDFGIDFVKAVHPDHRDQAAHDRVMEFMRAQFDVVSTDVNELNPAINMPRYIDEREFTYPIYTAVSRGAPPNGINPFQWPRFNSASGLVAAHTEGTEPTSGAYTTTSQSVTPTALSGKAKISREVWDMGGTPGLGDVIWRRITRDWYENLEAAVVTVLDNATPTALGTFTAGGGTTGQTLAAELEAALALLQFVRGGFRFDTAFAEAGLYTHLAAAKDDTGRALYPQMGPTNASGDAAARWSAVNVGGVPFLPAWALGATVGTVTDSSYLVDRTAVDAWATPPQRLTFDTTEVANVYVGVWGYKAAAINDLAGVREIAYDPTAV